MESSSFNLQNILAQFALLSFSYALAMGMVFLLVKLLSQASPSPYTLKVFGSLCIPGVLYSFLECVAEHQGLNFILVLFYLLIGGLIEILFIRRIPMKVYLTGACVLAFILWLVVPKGSIKLF
jgi:hypothetical protein